MYIILIVRINPLTKIEDRKKMAGETTPCSNDKYKKDEIYHATEFLFWNLTLSSHESLQVMHFLVWVLETCYQCSIKQLFKSLLLATLFFVIKLYFSTRSWSCILFRLQSQTAFLWPKFLKRYNNIPGPSPNRLTF